jgi:putative ABC transport system substrate-binding protein
LSSKAQGNFFESFRQGMRELGYEEGRNVAYDARWAEGRFDRLAGFATELVEQHPDVIVVATTPAVLAAKKATTTIPIVMLAVGDPVGTGLVDNLARPSGNVTGFTNIVGELAGKRLELLKQVVPRLSRVAAVGHPGDPIFAVQLRHAQTMAGSLGIEVFPVEIRALSEIDGAFETIAKRRADGVLRLADSLRVPGGKRTGELAMKLRIPTISPGAEDVESGLLMSYGARQLEQFHRAASYVDKLLKGAKPGDLPVEQPAKFDLVINLKTAKALGITIPQSVLLRADRVID